MIVPATSEFGLVTPFDISSSAIASTIIILPNPVGVVGITQNSSGPLSATLTPGWYGVMFGSGLFGASNTIANSIQLIDGIPANQGITNTYTLRNPIDPQSPAISPIPASYGHRYFVEGTITAVPAPPGWMLFLGFLIVLMTSCWGSRRYGVLKTRPL